MRLTKLCRKAVIGLLLLDDSSIRYRWASQKWMKKACLIYIFSFMLILACVSIQPLRNKVFYIVLPGAWVDLSTYRIFQLYYYPEAKYPVESTPVYCEDIKDVVARVPWARFEEENEHVSIPVYDDGYFNMIMSNLTYYGVSMTDLKRLKRHSQFKPGLTSEMQKELYLCLKVLVHALELFNVTYYVTGGAMIGVYRHHGLIPWDDDLDIAVKVSDWLKVKQILTCIPNFDLQANNGMMFKFFYKKSPLLNGETFVRFPFIDIFLLNEDAHLTWTVKFFKKHLSVYKKSDIYPVKKRPYGDILVSVPRTMEKMVVTVYNGKDKCVSRDYNHVEGKTIYFYRTIPCERLFGIYPFVKRTRRVIGDKTVLTESLMLGKREISSFTVHEYDEM